MTRRRVHYEEKETMVHVPWDDRSFTASVILSVFGQRKVKAQLNTENAGRSQAVGQMRNIFSHHLTMKKHFQWMHPTVLRCMQQIRRRRS